MAAIVQSRGTPHRSRGFVGEVNFVGAEPRSHIWGIKEQVPANLIWPSVSLQWCPSVKCGAAATVDQ